MTLPAPRTRERRRSDTEERLTHDVDAWVATANSDEPYLVPLSFLWDGTDLLLATESGSPTGRNLLAGRTVRLGIGHTRDVVLVEGTVDSTPAEEIPRDVGDAFAAKAGFDPRRSPQPSCYFRVRPSRIQAWREVDELPGRDLMRDGRWLVPADSEAAPTT